MMPGARILHSAEADVVVVEVLPELVAEAGTTEDRTAEGEE